MRWLINNGGGQSATYLANSTAIPAGWEAAGTTTVGDATFTTIRRIVQAVVPSEPEGPNTRLSGTASVGLNGISDWTVSYPFIDVFKTARIWIGHTAEQWGRYQFADLETDENGWLMSIPADCTGVEALLMVDLPAEMDVAAGTYVARWEGSGTIGFVGGARDVIINGNQATFNYAPGNGPVAVAITVTDPANPIRNITVMLQSNVAAYDEGEVFNPLWLDVIRGFRSLRFMDWQSTNGSTIQTWTDRTPVSFASWAGRDAPLEIMVELANKVKADPWFCIPHMADADFTQRFATYVRDNLDSDLVAYYEYSNEVWNFMFRQTEWLQDQAIQEFNEVGGDLWMQMAGIFAARTADTISTIYGVLPNYRNVIAVHTAWQGLEDGFLNAERYRQNHPEVAAPHESFDAYAVNGYFSGEMSEASKLSDIRAWIAESTPGTFDVAITNAVANIRSSVEGNSLTHLYANWDYHKSVADNYGLDLMMYEGGTHTIAPDGTWDELGPFYIALNYSPEMAQVYRDAMNRFETIGGISFNVFVEISYPARYGLWGALRYLGDTMTSKWDAISERKEPVV